MLIVASLGDGRLETGFDVCPFQLRVALYARARPCEVNPREMKPLMASKSKVRHAMWRGTGGLP